MEMIETDMSNVVLWLPCYQNMNVVVCPFLEDYRKALDDYLSELIVLQHMEEDYIGV